MKELTKLKVANACYAIVSNNFAMFCDTNNQGSNFKWDSFPNMMIRSIPNAIWTSIKQPSDKNKISEMEELAKELSEQIAKSLIYHAGFK